MHNNCVKITLNVKNDPRYINMLCESCKLPRCLPSWTRPGSWILETSIFIFYEYYPIRIFKILYSKWVLKFYSQPIGRIKTTYYSFKTCLIDAAAKNTWMFQKKVQLVSFTCHAICWVQRSFQASWCSDSSEQ